MTIATVLADIEDEAKIWETKAVTFLKGVAITETQKAVALLKQTSVGTAVANLVSSFQYSTLAGADKLTHVLAAADGVYTAFVAAGGLSGLLTVGVSVLRQLIQSVFDDFAAALASGPSSSTTAQASMNSGGAPSTATTPA